MRNEHQCWAIRNCKLHLIDDVEVNCFLSYFMQWVIGWCSLIELLLRKSQVFGLYFILFRKYRVSYK